MFFAGSRYLKVRDAAYTDSRGRTFQYKRSRPLADTDGVFSYQVKQGDRLDLLSQKFYRTPRKWWLICDANASVMDPAELLQTGRQIAGPKDRRD